MPDTSMPKVGPAAANLPPVMRYERSVVEEVREIVHRYFSNVSGDMSNIAEMERGAFLECLDDVLFYPPTGRNKPSPEDIAAEEAARRWVIEGFGDDFKALAIAAETLHDRILAALETT